jgi:hypothetical protein
MALENVFALMLLLLKTPVVFVARLDNTVSGNTIQTKQANSQYIRFASTHAQMKKVKLTLTT